jgi:hypothetical protein
VHGHFLKNSIEVVIPSGGLFFLSRGGRGIEGASRPLFVQDLMITSDALNKRRDHFLPK